MVSPVVADPARLIGADGLVGPVVQLATAVLLAGMFVLFAPLSSRKRLIGTWIIAWIAQAVAASGLAIASLVFLLGRDSSVLVWSAFIDPLHWPARFLFLAAVVIGCYGAVGRPFTVTTERFILSFAVLAGLVFAATGSDRIAAQVELLATPLVFFGGTQLLLRRAEGARARGLISMSVAMMFFGSLTTLYLMASATAISSGPMGRMLHLIRASSGYGDAIALALLAAAAIVVIVQESFLDVAAAHNDRITEVGASEARLKGIIHAAQEAIITTDGRGQVDMLNGAAERLFEWEADQAIGRQLRDLIVDPPEAIVRALEGQLDLPTPGASGGDIATYTATARRRDGSCFPAEFTIGRVGAAARPGLVVVLRDLTERRAATAERESFERRMAESEKMLAVGRIVSGIAHELNNPLAVVLGQSEQLVHPGPTDDEVQLGLRLIHEQAYRARHIVKDLLAFVRQREDPVEPVDLGQVIARAVESQIAAGVAQGIVIAQDVTPGLPTLMANRVTIEQVIVNLLDNACDAAGAGGKVWIRASRTDDTVRIAVEDDGPGVPADLMDRIFEPFFTTKAPGRGTGLGLSVSRGLAQQQHGRLTVERHAGATGARFLFEMPCGVPAAVGGGRAVKTPTFPPPPLQPDGSARQVLIIDDEPSVRATLGKMFRRSGWPVHESSGAQEALDWLATVDDAAAPAIILCDIKMPGMNGRAFYEQLVRVRPALAPRVIFVTGDVVEPVSTSFFAATGRDVVEKPFTVAEVGSTVARVVNSQ